MMKLITNAQKNSVLPELLLIMNQKMSLYSSASIAANPLLAAVKVVRVFIYKHNEQLQDKLKLLQLSISNA